MRRIVIVILAATVSLSARGQVTKTFGNDSHRDVTATVRSSPIVARLQLYPRRVRIHQVVIAIVVLSNISDDEVLVLGSNLSYEPGALLGVVQVGAGKRMIRPHERSVAIWLLRAMLPGTFVVVASVEIANGDAETIRVDSDARLVEIR